MCLFVIVQIDLWESDSETLLTHTVTLREPPQDCTLYNDVYGDTALVGDPELEDIAHVSQLQEKVTNLWPDKEMFAQVRVVNGKGPGPRSYIVPFHTLKESQPRMKYLQVTEQGSRHVRIKYAPQTTNPHIEGMYATWQSGK